MNQSVNEIYRPLFEQTARYFILMGGRGRGGSTVASQYANAKLLAPDYFRCAIMRYILGDIRNSIYREIIDRAEENDIFNKLSINGSLMSIGYNDNSINAVGFRKSSSDQKSKLKSLASYNCVIIEESDEIPEADFMQLDDSLRTVKGDIKIILILNPPAKNHWIIKRWLNILPSVQDGFYEYELRKDIKDTILIKGTYLDNIKNIAPASVQQYENYKKTKPNHYWNMVKGLVPETVVGKIYNNWIKIDSIPDGARLERYGLDFGYSNDPTAIVSVYKYNDGIILDELLYQKGMLNSEIAAFMKGKEDLIIADSSEPKSIDELLIHGLNVIGSTKGQGSVNQGIQRVQGKTISVTSRSTNLLEEYENYAWKIDKNTGDGLNVPIDLWNHCMDAARYAITDIYPIEDEKAPESPYANKIPTTYIEPSVIPETENNWESAPVESYE